jgi:hypothetical protein
VTLQCPELQRGDTEWAPRLRYAYAEALLAVGRGDEAAEWFRQAAEADVEGVTDAEERWAEFYGVMTTFADGDGVDDEDPGTAATDGDGSAEGPPSLCPQERIATPERHQVSPGCLGRLLGRQA